MKISDLGRWSGGFAALILAGGIASAPACRGATEPNPDFFPNVPKDYLREADNPPDFWVSTVDGVTSFLGQHVHRGTVVVIGQTAGGRPIRAVFYGQPRKGKGTTTLSGAIGAGDMHAYVGPDYAKKVYWVMAAVHGGEFEGIVGLVNLLSVLETGKDLRGKPWPEIVAAAARIDRLIVIPIVNMDGRARLPMRMEAFRGTDGFIPEYLNTGGWSDHKLIGWPQCKAFIPMDFSRTQFPGGYPNDNGVNLMHDDFFGARQPETQALFDLAARERPDLILNLHTGVGANDYFARMHLPVMEEVLRPAFNGLYRTVHTALANAGMQGSKDLAVEAEPPLKTSYGFNLDSALDFHCGVLSVVVEFPSHGYAGRNQKGDIVRHTADDLLDEELLVQAETMKYFVETGGRSRWAAGK
jgi:hypothetical protein